MEYVLDEGVEEKRKKMRQWETVGGVNSKRDVT
jgi:hypothetical protein